MGELFSTFGINVSLLVTQIVNFGVLLLGLWWFLYRPAIGMLDERRAKIQEGVENAEKAETRLAEVATERDEVLSTARTDASGIIAQAKERADEQASVIVSDANKRADTLLSDAAARAEEAKAKALRESREEIGRAAILAAEKVLREKQS